MIRYETSIWENNKKISFTVNERLGFIIVPHNPISDKKWIWRAEFFGAFDTADRALLAKGWYIAYYDVSNMYGSPRAIRLMKDFFEIVTTEFSLSKKTVLFGFSRGGLYSVNYALTYPEDIACLYLDAPVLRIQSWPRSCVKAQKEWHECMDCYGLTEETADSFCENPLDRVSEIAVYGIPILIIAGDSDEIVPYTENGQIFAQLFLTYGGVIKTIVKKGVKHHPHSLEDPLPIIEFIEKF
ncbi:MAG: hypothetical protein K0R09_3964 [Clostridiales bacterium]|jgi:pimeloyl-ACP methyl ester carboxylesterase|nr:hypothetical protein [Clostridiales bacterium]